MKQRPIIFNTEMVQAIVDGRKTQTRRMFKAQPHDDWAPFSKNAEWYTPTIIDKRGFYQPANDEVFGVSDEDCAFVSPFGTIGDQFWVRETWRQFNSSDECGCSEYPCGCPNNGTVLFKATGDSGESKWKPSIHMPRSCARILLEVTAVRVERLDDISEQDAKAEGFDYPAVPGMGWKLNAKHNFLFAWDKIYGNRSSNPFVWVIEFKVISTTGGEE
ncbi:hypothetical protein ACRN9T_03285 [Shewanella baltica]|uniref:hypothetical protein n=1 Tax=Shewanella baltica TaxID=62322 RepID=UPI003D7BC2DE